jgi:hypothetical protein
MNVRPTYSGGRWDTRRSARKAYVANRGKKKKKAKVKRRKRARRAKKVIRSG